MRIVFVRHGHPDYKNDCLTELGHSQAEAAAKRLADERPIKICASPQGRAYQTAEHIAKKLNMSIEVCDFMRETAWGSINGEEINRKGHPWYVADDMVAEGTSVMKDSWAIEEYYSNNKVVERVQTVCDGFDAWLEAFGYKRDGYYYRIEKPNNDTVFMVSHGGSSTAAISHMLNIAFPHYCATVRPEFTSITVITISGEAGSLVIPQIEILNDWKHIVKVNAEATFDQ
jgi:probable phosphoglycerate mutase